MREYLDLTKEYYILVPLNKDSLEKMYRYDIFENGRISNDYLFMAFHEDTYVYLESRLFDFINVESGLLINMYEEEIADTAMLPKVRSVTELILQNSGDDRVIAFATEFLTLIKAAEENGTAIGFFF